MSKLRAVMMMADVTTYRTVHPLICFLKTKPPMTELLRDFLIELLEQKGKFKLKLIAPRGHESTPAESEHRLAIYYRFEELAGAKIKSIFCDEIAKSLRSTKEVKHRKLARNDYDDDQKGIETTYFISGFRFVKGKIISRELAFKLVAQQFRRSVPGVKKIVRSIDATRRYDVPFGEPWIPKDTGLPVQPAAKSRVKSARATARKRR
jgi:hypothetical protein